jgi:transposase
MVQEAMPLDLSIPDNLSDCQRLLCEVWATLKLRDRELAGVQHRLELLLRRVYGPRSERYEVGGPTLFDSCPTPPEPPPPSEPAEPPIPELPKKKRKTPHGRKPLPKDLPHHRREHEPTEAEKLCPCCGKPRMQLGEQTSEQLEYIPASLRVIVHVRPTFACVECLRKAELAPAAPEVVEPSSAPAAAESSPAAPMMNGTAPLMVVPPTIPSDVIEMHTHQLIYTVPMPKQPIAKGLAGPGLLAHIITSKFVDHLPLYRQEKIFARQGVDISRSTMSDWMAQCAELCTPLYELMKQRVLKSRVIHNDDTPVPVLAPKTGKTKTGRLWASVGDAANPYNVFNYTADRTRDGPEQFFKGYKGWLQVDAYSGYEGLFRTGDIHESACWAHARRKFYDARSTDAERSHVVLGMICGLYEVEDEVVKIVDEAAKSRYRRQHARPLLIKIKRLLKQYKDQVLPKSPIGDAIGYALNNWRALNRYVLFGFLSIDNNVGERALRGIAIGRKNYLFLGSDAGGNTAAVLYSLVSTCERHGIDPWAYLRDALTRLPELPAERLEELLPDVWANAQRAQSEAQQPA